ncbi:hypothetical protein MKEN_00221400 [Mycena kentingensis (nom. inval.)]|nr:hypothetical protein MKEN_00221400 [Mycena kentingensis (nom. inval.)]
MASRGDVGATLAVAPFLRSISVRLPVRAMLPPPASTDPSPLARGGWVGALFGDLLLQGVIYTQVASYYAASYRTDVLAFRLFVAGLAGLTTLKSVQNMYFVWKEHVEMQDPNVLYPSAIYALNPALVAFIAFYVQTFLCHRLLMVSKNIWLVAGTVVVFVFAFVAALVSTVPGYANGGSISLKWLAVHLATVFVGDTVLCGLMVYFLLKHSEEASPATVGLLNAVITLTILSAAPAALCALLNFIFNQLAMTSISWGFFNFVANQLLPKLYAFSAMWTLNARRGMRDRLYASRAGRVRKGKSRSVSGEAYIDIDSGMPAWRVEGSAGGAGALQSFEMNASTGIEEARNQERSKLPVAETISRPAASVHVRLKSV